MLRADHDSNLKAGGLGLKGAVLAEILTSKNSTILENPNRRVLVVSMCFPIVFKHCAYM